MSRIITAIEFIKNGQPFDVEGLNLGINEENDFYVTGWSQYNNLENITKTIAINELSEIKKQFNEMVETTPELSDFLQNRIVKYNLAFNYGMGSIGICSEKKGILRWELSALK